MWRLVRCLVFAGFGLLLALTPRPVAASPADSLHWASWDSSLAWSGRTRAIRFSFYAYRTLAVPHPEVYLQADRLFSDVIENLPGSRLAYRSRNVRDLEFYSRLARRELKGAPFTWSSWMYSPDSVSDPDATRDDGAVSWLDRRLPSAAVLLRGISAHLSTVEATALNYTRRRRQGGECDSLFVVIDSSGRGYLAENSVLLRAGIWSLSTLEASAVCPAIVFNERSVYYPLFGRDDRLADSALDRLLRRLGPPAAMDFSSTELSRLLQLRQVAALPDRASKQLAVLIASGLVDIANPHVRTAWMEYLGTSDSVSLACVAGMVPEADFWADRLSARAAELAARVREDSLPGSLPLLQDDYLRMCGQHVNPIDSGAARVEAWGVLWSSGLLQTTLDDIARTRAGSGASQGTAMSAILDLAGIPHLGLLVDAGKDEVPDQHWLLTADGRFQFNLGIWTPIPEVSGAVRRATIVATGYTKPGYWAQFADGGFCTDLDPLTVAEDLTKIITVMPGASLMFHVRPGSLLSGGQLAGELINERLLFRAMPWPSNQ